MPRHHFFQPKLQLVALAIIFLALPLAIFSQLWMSIWSGVESRAWDGTGHFSMAQLYSQSIFPNTFGWSGNFFGGMPFPNFYPPAFYWLVAALHHTHLVSFETAFKLALTLPVLLIPLAIWALGWRLSGRNWMVASGASLTSILLLTDMRFMGSLLAGLDYFSTFQVGLYTQPLGFVLMISWFLTYSENTQFQARRGLEGIRLAAASVLLALTVLSNFFNAITAVVLVLSILVFDLLRYMRSPSSEQRRTEGAVLISHLLSPIIAMCLTLFWAIPMLSEYSYFVTRPQAFRTDLLISPWLVLFYVIAAAGVILWIRGLLGRPTADKAEFRDARKARPRRSHTDWQYPANVQAAWPYITTCVVLAAGVISAATIAPGWFPLQAPRFLATLTLLLSVPVGFALAFVFAWLATVLGESSRSGQPLTIGRARYTIGVFFLAFLVLVFTSPALSWIYAFYPEGKIQIDEVLDFARRHNDGRYLVEVVNPQVGPAWTEASFDARAISSYLGAQGNETISGVFHEASPSALFTLPVVNAFSNYPDSFGISSVLADDLDFSDQPLAEHSKRGQILGIKYLVIRTPAMKERVSKDLPDAIRHDLGWWAVFELSKEPPPKIQALPYKPALVVSNFTLKARRRNESSFVRLVEEQFSDNWFDVLLVRSPESRLDRLQNLHHFGAIIVDKYDYENEHIAFERLREFAKTRLLICLSSDNVLFRRLKAAQADLPWLKVIERQPEDPGEMVDALKPTHRYGASSIRQQWKTIRSALESQEIATKVETTNVTGEYGQNTIHVNYVAAPSDSVPILISTTFHPNWLRDDGEAVYAATPFFMVTFVDGPITMTYGRTLFDKLGLWVSALTLFGLFLFVFWSYRRNLVRLLLRRHNHQELNS